ncbi:glycosyltransferase [Orbaceae bacterium ESL0727]|nr:glycosyltransferase [Orbaceae bacterium ESL0727]
MINESVNISVIIPCYNTEKYLQDCLDSLINQSCAPKEIICIDDGSTDNTAIILNHYANQYEHIKIISQSNLGVSHARNNGIELATGEYILFVDSDDIVHTNLFYDFTLALAAESNLELFYFDYLAFKNKENITINTQPSIQKDFQTGIELLSYLLEQNNYSGVTWRYIFKNKLITTKFIESTHEDHLISLSIFEKAKCSCYFMHNAAYFHRIHNLSLSNHNIDITNTNTFKKVLTSCFKIINELPLSIEAKRNYILLMNATYLETLLKSTNQYSLLKREEIIEELGLLKILIRIYVTHKTSILRNICYISKFSKSYPCLWQTKKILLKCAITKQHPLINIDTKFDRYSALIY